MNFKPPHIESGNISNTIHFKGKQPLIVAAELTLDEIRRGAKLLNCGVDELVKNTTDTILKGKNHTKFVTQAQDGLLQIKERGFFSKLGESVTDILKLPLKVTNSAVEKLYKKHQSNRLLAGLNNSLDGYRKNVASRQAVSALGGMHENIAKLLKEIPNSEDAGIGVCTPNCQRVCDRIKDDVNKLLNDSMAFGKPTGTVKDERFVTRLVSGFTAATFLYNDFLNKGELKKKQVEEYNKAHPDNPKKEVDPDKYAQKKRSQEIISNIGEAVVQFAILSVFFRKSNTSKWFSAVTGAAIGLGWNILSRLITKSPLTKIPVPPENEQVNKQEAQSPKTSNNMQEFMTLTKPAKGIMVTPDAVFLSNHPNVPLTPNNAIVGQILKHQNSYIEPHTEKTEDKEAKDKKHLLSLKNIAVVCAGIIATGFTLRFAKNKILTSENETIKNVVKAVQKQVIKLKKAYRNKTVEKVFMNKKELSSFTKQLGEAQEEKLLTSIINKTQTAFKKAEQILIKQGQTPEEVARNAKIFIGRKDKTVKLFGKVEVPVRKLFEDLAAPFKFIKDIVMYPYQKVCEVLKGMGKLADTKKKIDIKAPDDIYNFKNIFVKFKEFEAKHSNPEKLTEEFGNYVKQMRIVSNSNATAKIDPAAIGVLASVINFVTGIRFNMIDERNTSIEMGKTEKEADKDGRLRAVNKFFRMVTQGVMIGVLNQTFVKQYNGSLPKAALITFACTMLTDSISRVLTGMPFKRMSAEEQIDYKEKQKNGSMKGYFKFIDKLAD